jgi:hypothetical protein
MVKQRQRMLASHTVTHLSRGRSKILSIIVMPQAPVIQHQEDQLTTMERISLQQLSRPSAAIAMPTSIPVLVISCTNIGQVI